MIWGSTGGIRLITELIRWQWESKWKQSRAWFNKVFSLISLNFSSNITSIIVPCSECPAMLAMLVGRVDGGLLRRSVQPGHHHRAAAPLELRGLQLPARHRLVPVQPAAGPDACRLQEDEANQWVFKGRNGGGFHGMQTFSRITHLNFQCFLFLDEERH